MTRTGRLAVLAGVLSLALAVAGVVARPVTAQRPADGLAPRFQVDPFWPRPLPNRWLLGQVSGVAVDSRDHVWIVQRPKSLTEDERGATANPPRNACCAPAPPVMEFDAEGNLLQAWGGPGAGYDWPANEHGIYVDPQGNVWLAGNGEKDAQILKFARDGRFLMQIGKPGASKGDTDTANLGRPADVRLDPATNELFVADGYGNHRVIVFDAGTGAYKRHWGANGRPPGDASVKQFQNPVHCIRIARDGLVYVCDRRNNRIQVFRKDGTFVKEQRIMPTTRGDGSVWDIAFSRDPQQKYLYLADGKNEHVYVMDRQSLQILTMFGDGGRQPGQWFAVHSIATDSKGNIFTTETYEGKRLQKFVYKGIKSVPKNQGVVWPK
jgi:DNA-binding beta-propeller fold protein YncE